MQIQGFERLPVIFCLLFLESSTECTNHVADRMYAQEHHSGTSPQRWRKPCHNPIAESPNQPPPQNTFKHFQTSFWYPSSLTTRRKPSESPYIIERQILPTLFSQSYHYFPGHRYHNPPHQTSCRKQNKDISINPLSNSPSSMNPTLSLMLQIQKSKQQQHRQRTQRLHFPPLVSGDPTPALTKQKKLSPNMATSQTTTQLPNLPPVRHEIPNTSEPELYYSTQKPTASSTIHLKTYPRPQIPTKIKSTVEPLFWCGLAKGLSPPCVNKNSTL